MSIYFNNKKLSVPRISHIYKGNILVYGPIYPIGTVLLEKSVAGSYSIELKPGLYEIYCIGGGGGGSNGPGGSGAGILLQVHIQNTATYTSIVGAHGAGAGAYVRNNNGFPGGASSLNGNNISITTNGGAGRAGRRNGGWGGTTGTLEYNITIPYKVINRTTNGVENALSFLTNNSSGPGAGGIAQPNDKGAGYAGKPGYIKISYAGI